ncbi:MAG: hypothetical protein ACPG7U_03130 [Holosporaceae bacterium]
MHHRFFIFCLSFLLAYTPLAFAPQGDNQSDQTPVASANPAATRGAEGQTSQQRVKLIFDDEAPLFLTQHNPQALELTLPKKVSVPASHLQNVRHLYLNSQKIPRAFLVELTKIPLKTLDLSGSKFLHKGQQLSSGEALFLLEKLTSLTSLTLSSQQIPTMFFDELIKLPLTTLNLSRSHIFYPLRAVMQAEHLDEFGAQRQRPVENLKKLTPLFGAIFKLHKLTSLTSLNLRYLSVDSGNGIGDIIRRQCNLTEAEALLPQHREALIENNPIGYLKNLESLDLTDARVFWLTDCLDKCAPKLRVLRLKGNRLDHRPHAFLDRLVNLQELETNSLDWLFGTKTAAELSHDDVAPLSIPPTLNVLNLGGSKANNTHLKRLAALEMMTELALGACKIASNPPGDEDISHLESRGHLLLGQFPLKVLDAHANPSLQRIPVFMHPLHLTKANFDRCGLQSLDGIGTCVNLTELNLNENPCAPFDAWRFMLPLKQLRVLEFAFRQDANIRQDFSLRQVREYDAQTRADCIKVLAQNTHLTTLFLLFHAIGLEAATALTDLHCLENLILTSCSIGDDGFKKLPLLNMRNLSVKDNALTAESARHLRRTFEQTPSLHLKMLSLEHNPLGDEAMEPLASMTCVDFLHLRDVGATDAGMEKLLPLKPHLDFLSVKGNAISPELAADLSRFR